MSTPLKPADLTRRRRWIGAAAKRVMEASDRLEAAIEEGNDIRTLREADELIKLSHELRDLLEVRATTPDPPQPYRPGGYVDEYCSWTNSIVRRQLEPSEVPAHD